MLLSMLIIKVVESKMIKLVENKRDENKVEVVRLEQVILFWSVVILVI